ncbi:hypothetical protein PRIPAC_95758 [Pristionchus pacificus]|uniref:Nuclear receptor n=1 Tax=Pristionchus pacificus TaxID=54126 RepID=A0A2A6D373_PRIPA|nr:hypothetical protein PRIPAC_95758 [Pristionchus pacificus]|eukprot:PDM84733.1 nuclear receptor [Pristionchus pacificus]
MIYFQIFHCLVCRAVITHTNMGIESCRACGVFYRRTVKLKYRLECHCHGKDASKRETIISCRKCRFEKMKDLVNRATAGEISCVNDGTSRNENDSEIDNKGRDIEIKESNDSLPNWSPTSINLQNSSDRFDDHSIPSPKRETLPAFIDHSYSCEASCSETPLLNKMMTSYSTMCSVRKSFEISALHQREMFAELGNGQLSLRKAKYSDMAAFSKIFFIGLSDFAQSAFPEFNDISAENRVIFGQSMASYTTFVKDETIEEFFSNCAQEVNREHAVKIFRKNMDQLIKVTKLRFRKLIPSIEEFMALIGLALWNDFTLTAECQGDPAISRHQRRLPIPFTTRIDSQRPRPEMKFPILLVAYTAMTLAKDVYSGSCYYDDEVVFEVGYAPRPMSGAERDEMRVYGMQWQQYGEQVRNSTDIRA